MGIEHRKQKRLVLRKNVFIHNTVQAMGLDLSEGGLYVHTGRDFKAGTIIELTLPVANPPLKVQARVQHSQQGIGMGLKFMNLTPEQKACIKEYIDTSVEETESSDTRKKILLIDKNPSNRRLYKSKLVLEGFTVLEASDAPAAIKMLETDVIDLIVFDLFMEKVDGFKVLAIFRSRPEWRDIPVLVFSSRSSNEDIERAISAGASEFLVRMTTSPSKLSDRVKLHLKGQPPGGARPGTVSP